MPSERDEALKVAREFSRSHRALISCADHSGVMSYEWEELEAALADLILSVKRGPGQNRHVGNPNTK